MLKHHGFFVPFAEYLHDVEGFLTYLGAKVGMGKVCLWCNGRGRAFYPDLESLQKHMTAKSHCKIRFEEDETDDEFVDYYLFPHQIKAAEDAKRAASGAVVVAPTTARAMLAAKAAKAAMPLGLGEKRRTLHSMNDADELVMSDGSVIGHRSMRQAYDLNVRVGNSTDEELASIQGAYNTLGMAGLNAVTKAARKAKQSETRHFMKRIEKAKRIALSVQYRANNKKFYLDPTAHLM